MLHEPAMTEDEMVGALHIGLELATIAQDKRQTLIAVGRDGNRQHNFSERDNSSPYGPSCRRGHRARARGSTRMFTSARSGSSMLSSRSISTKVPKLLRRNRLRFLRRVGGLEIAAMVGLFLGAARHQIPVITDGFISTAAAALACALEPRTKDYLSRDHCSKEPGHHFLLEHLGLDPILTLDMRLGEGTGAVLAMPIIEAALRLYTVYGNLCFGGC